MPFFRLFKFHCRLTCAIAPVDTCALVVRGLFGGSILLGKTD